MDATFPKEKIMKKGPDSDWLIDSLSPPLLELDYLKEKIYSWIIIQRL